MSDEAPNMAAVLELLNAALPTQTRAYDIDKIPATLPSNYVEVTVSRRFGGNLRSTATAETTGWRVTTRAISEDSITNARNTAKKVKDALEFARLTVAGKTSTPVQFETTEPAGPDEGWFSALTAWTYAL